MDSGVRMVSESDCARACIWAPVRSSLDVGFVSELGLDLLGTECVGLLLADLCR